MIKLFILLSMIFCHIVDDYYLQGWLASAKQKLWWKQNAPDKMYRYDYLMALFMHSFSWTFMIMLVPTIYIILFGGLCDIALFYVLFLCNISVHIIVDDMKANKKEINLVQDQLIHLGQVVVTWILMIIK